MENDPNSLENIELRLLLEGIYLRYGYDFRSYSAAHVKRRLLHRLQLETFTSFSSMQERILRDAVFFDQILMDLSINVTEMFRDPPFYQFFRREVIPVLKTYPSLKIWHAGCATGEEVYSMAILLMEEGLYSRAQIYATDFNVHALQKARNGIFPIERMKEFTANYQRAGGKHSFADYYTAGYDSVIFMPALRDQVTFTDHNLVTDGSFGEMTAIICRNVLIYFNRELQDRVFRLFDSSLIPGGFLCLGTKETVLYSSVADEYETLEEYLKVYRKRVRPRMPLL